MQPCRLRSAWLGAVLACTLAGCKLSHEVAPERFATVRYGLDRPAVLERLDVEPAPLVTCFGSVVGGRTWRAFGCEAQSTSQDYVLLFADGELVAVTTMETGRAAWEGAFDVKAPSPNDVFKSPEGEADPPLPDAADFAALGTAIVASRLDLVTHDFAQESAAHMGLVESTLYGIALTPLWLPLWPLAAGMLPYAIWSEFQFEAAHERFRGTIDAFAGGESTGSVIEVLGEPTRRGTSGTEEVLVYAPKFAGVQGWPTSLGFTNDRLFWIAWNYSPIRLGNQGDSP